MTAGPPASWRRPLPLLICPSCGETVAILITTGDHDAVLGISPAGLDDIPVPDDAPNWHAVGRRTRT